MMAHVLNPRFALFISATGQTRPALYQAWIMQQWSAWRALSGIDPDCTMTDEQHVAFDLWLESQHARFALLEGSDVAWTGFGHELIAANPDDDEIAQAVAEMHVGERREIAGGACGDVTIARLSERCKSAPIVVIQ